MIRRYLESAALEALDDTRVVLLHGARQTGKSTLARRIAEMRGGHYLTLDDPGVRAAAISDPVGFVRGAAPLTVIDEVQHAPSLFPAIKMEVDKAQRAGQFLLTGSANVLLVPRISESLAGRIGILTLQPLSQDEIAGTPCKLLDDCFDAAPWQIRSGGTVDRTDVCARILAGGFPEAVGRERPERRNAWFRDYVQTIVYRDIRDLARIEGLSELPNILALLAARTAGLLNVSDISRASGIQLMTLRRYLALLDTVYLHQPLPAWSANLSKRIVKAPKVHLLDSGLTASLRGETSAATLAQSPAIGPLLETFVLQELRKLASWGRTPTSTSHFRTPAGQEVDIVLERGPRAVVGVEAKSSTTLAPKDFTGLRALAESAGDAFVRGVVLYLGEHTLPFGDNLWAVPVSALWEWT